MKKVVKNSLLISMGLFMGLTASSYGALEKITVFKDNVTSIFIEGKKLQTSSDVINHKGTLYVPLRVVSENMNMNVSYDKSNKTVNIAKKPLSKEEELAKKAQIHEEAVAEAKKLKAQDKEEARKEEVKQSSNIDYKSLPITYINENFSMKMTLVVREDGDGFSEFYFDVKNKNPYGMVIDPFSAKFNYTGEHRDYELSGNVPSAIMDKKVLSSLDTDFDSSLYLTLEKIPKNVSQGTLSFNIRKVGDTEYTKVIMPVKF